MFMPRQAAAVAAPAIVGRVRVTALAEQLVRLEVRGPRGFVDAPTFMATGRRYEWANIERNREA